MQQFPPIPGTLVIGLGHKARHGKDTVAQAMLEAGRSTVARIGFADALYDYCRVEHGMTTKDAPLLQRVGVEMRGRNPLTWINAVYWKIVDFSARWNRKTPQVVVIPDVRFINEAEFVRGMGGYLIKVERRDENDVLYQATDRDPNHVSEAQLDGYSWDLTITNRSVAQTQYNAIVALDFFRKIFQCQQTISAAAGS